MVRVASKPVVAVRAPAVEVPAAVQRLTIDEGSVGQRLDNFLIKVLKGAPKTLVYRIIRSGEVRVNKGRAAADTRLEMGDEVRVPPLRLTEKSDEQAAAVPAREFPVLFEDDAVLAINKPAGVAVHGGSGVSFGVIEQLRQARPAARLLELVHRLDRETSGLLLIAKKKSALKALQDHFFLGILLPALHHRTDPAQPRADHADAGHFRCLRLQRRRLGPPRQGAPALRASVRRSSRAAVSAPSGSPLSCPM